ncbi:MAG: DUF4174 domain-containing protein [Pseudomonadota bacterium]
MAGSIDLWAWQYRPLIVVAPDAEDPRLLEQRTQLSGLQDQLRDRDMAVVELVGGQARTIAGPAVEIDVARLVERLGLSVDRFEVLLVGKDTGIKLRSSEPVIATDLFGLIDGMPMRRREMRQ